MGSVKGFVIGFLDIRVPGLAVLGVPSKCSFLLCSFKGCQRGVRGFFSRSFKGS